MPDTEDVSLLVGTKEFGFWTHVEAHLQIDSISTIAFGAPFESDRRAFRDVFRPYTYKGLEAKVAGEALFTGTVIPIQPRQDPSSSDVSVSGYALPGVLADCNAPADTLPLEFKGLGLKSISEALTRPFGIGVVFPANEGAKFDKPKMAVNRKILDFLSDLARQRNLVVGNTPLGELLFHQSVAAGSPVAQLKDNEEPVTGVTARFNSQEYFSEITGFAKTKKGRIGSRYTVQNPRLTNVLRPMSFELKDTKPADVPAAVEAKMGRMFANSVSYIVDVATWRDPDGNLWKPNTTITLEAPDSMVYKETELLIRGVILRQDISETTASLELVLPGAFSGKTPEVLPWDEPLL